MMLLTLSVFSFSMSCTTETATDWMTANREKQTILTSKKFGWQYPFLQLGGT